MKKRWIRGISLILSAVLVLLFCVTVFAADTESPETDPIAEEYVNINSCNCYCSISGLKIYADANLTARSSMSLSIKIELQKLKSGSYETIETWNASKTGVSLSLSEDRLINLLATYRIKVTFTAGGESTTKYAYP